MVFHSPKDKDLSKPPEGEENQAQQHSDAGAAASAQAAQQEKQEVVETEKTDMQMAESLLKKGNTLGLDQEENDIMDLLDLVVKYLINPDVLRAQEIANKFESLQFSLGTGYVKELFKFMDESMKYEEQRQFWRNSLWEPKKQGRTELLALVNVEERLVESLFVVVEAIQNQVQRLQEEAQRARKKVEETPVPYHKTEFKTQINTPTITKARLLETSDASSDGAFLQEEKLRTMKEEIDPLPNCSFKIRARHEPTYEHYRDVSSRMAHPRMNFDSLVTDLKAIFKNPRAKDGKRAARLLDKVEDAFDLLRDMQLEATKDFSVWTITQDTYLDKMQASVLGLKELNQKFFGRKRRDDSIASLRNVPCPDCQSEKQNVFFTYEELTLHQKRFHQELKINVPQQPQQRNLQQQLTQQPHGPHEELVRQMRSNFGNQGARTIEHQVALEEAEEALEQEKKGPMLPPMGDYGAGKTDDFNENNFPQINQSIPRDSDQDSLRSADYREEAKYEKMIERLLVAQTEQMKEQMTIQNKQNEEQMKQRREKSYIKMAQSNARANFDPAKICGLFAGNSNTNEDFRTYAAWRIDFKQLDRQMNELGYSNTEKYNILKERCDERAKRVVTITHEPTETSYDEALEKLDRLFVNKSLQIRDLYSRIKNLEPMHAKSAAKVAEMVIKTFSLIDQLVEKKPSNEELLFMLIFELLASKLNAEASKKLKKLWQPSSNNQDDSNALGHSLTVQDLKRIMTETRDEMQWSEYSETFNKAEGKNQQEGKKEDGRKKKDTLYGSNQTKNEEGQEKSKGRGKQPSNGKGVCPIPKCQASLDPKEEGGHRWILKCKAMKEMKPNDLWSWVHQYKVKCFRCFDLEHTFENCHVKNWQPCSKKITTGDRAGEICGSNEHNVWLHRDPKPKKKKEKSTSNQTRAEEEEGTNTAAQNNEQ